MGALQNGVSENELEPIVKKWRTSSPNIVQFWYALEDASIEAVKWHHATTVNGIGLPSGTVHRVTSFSQLQPDILISSYRSAGNDPARSQKVYFPDRCSPGDRQRHTHHSPCRHQ